MWVEAFTQFREEPKNGEFSGPPGRLENGADTRYIQAMLGHARLDTTQIYTKVSIRALKAVHTATHSGRMPEAGRERAEEET